MLASEGQLHAERPGPGDTYDAEANLEYFDSEGGGFRVWFVRDTSDAVDPTDAAPANGIPDLVELVAKTAEDVHASLTGDLGFRAPLLDTRFGLPEDVGGDSRFDIYLRSFGAGDGHFALEACGTGPEEAMCSGYFEMERDFRNTNYSSTEEAVMVLVSHEYFHAIQAAYRVGSDPKWSEGTATWAEEIFYPQQSDFERLLAFFLDAMHRPFDRPSGAAFDGYAYGAAAFPWHLSERYGSDVIREIWDALASEPSASFLDAIDQKLVAEFETTLAEEWIRFARMALFTGERASAEDGFADGAAWPSVTFEEYVSVSTLPETFETTLEGMSARYIPILTSGPMVLSATATGAPIHLSLNLETASGWSEVAGWSDQNISIPSEEGLAFLILTSAERGGLPRRVSITLAEPEPAEEPEPPMDTGCSAGRTSPGGGAFFAGSLALLMAGLRRRRSLRKTARANWSNR